MSQQPLSLFSSSSPSVPWLSHGGLLFGAACWGIVWYPYRLLEQAGVSGVAASLYTYAIACCFGVLLFCRYWRNMRLLPRNIFWLALAAGWTNLSYVLAVIEGEVMRIMLLFYLSPIWTLLLAHFWLKERADLKGVMVVMLSLTGAFVMLHASGQWPLPRNTAEWLALASGVGFSFTNVITRRSSHLSIAAKSMAVWVGVFCMALIFLPFETSPVPLPGFFSMSQWLLMGFVAFLLFSATLCVQYGLTHVPATRASVLFLFELVVAAIAAYFLAGESLSPHEWVGGALIVSAAMLAARGEHQ